MANPHTARTLARRAYLVVAMACCWMVAGATDWVEPRTALDRPGTHHAGYLIQVVDDQGRPVAATVAVNWSATTTTDENGHAELRDVSTEGWPFIWVGSSGRHRPRHLRLKGVTNGIADLGIVRLERNVVVTGRVKRASNGGAPIAGNEGRVSLYAVDDGEMLGFAPLRDGRFRLDDFDIEPMEIEYSPWSSPDHRAPLPIDPERHRQHFELTVERGLLRVVESRDVPAEPAPDRAEEPTHRLALRLVDTEGEPIRDAEVDVPLEYAARSTFTDTDGRFSMDTVGAPERLYVLGPWGMVSIGVESPKNLAIDVPRPDWSYSSPDVVADITAHSEIEIPVLRRVELEVSGIDPRDLAYSWNRGGQWRTIDQTLVERVFADLRRSLVRIDAPGRLPRFAAYPPPGPLVLDYTEDRQHALVVVDEDGPVAGATVDLIEVATPYLDRVAVNDPKADIVLASLATDADGRLARLGNPLALYVAYVYAEGYDPARVVLLAGSESRVKLVKRAVRVDFTGLSAGELMRVKVAGRESLVALQRVVDGSPVAVPLAPGSYDVTVETTDGVIDRGTTFVVDRVPRVVNTTIDRRPIVVVRLPELPVVPERHRSEEEAASSTSPVDRWVVWAHRHAPHARVSRTYAERISGRSGFKQSVEVETLEGPGEEPARSLRFPGSGRWLVCVAAERRSYQQHYFIEVELPAGEQRELSLPQLDATLEGTYERDVLANTHGVAGPRVLLIRAGGADAGWNVVNHFPGQPGCFGRRALDVPEHHDFVMHNLPAGDYHLFHHLDDEPVWGGVEVSLHTGRTTTTSRLGSERRGTWTVGVVDAKGRPVHHQVLRIRDQMLEAWNAYWEVFHSMGVYSSAEYAADAIPLPPAARLGGAPVSFESIRPGWVELVLDDPAGPARHYLRKAEPGTTLTLVVDD